MNARELENELMKLFIELRRECRDDKEWEKADKIRHRLKEIGIVLEDGNDGTVWLKQ